MYGELKEYINFGILQLEQLTPLRVSRSTLFAVQHPLKGADAVIASLAHETDSSLATFDKELQKKVEKKIRLI